jgi:DNA-binding response OmpR family regulator
MKGKVLCIEDDPTIQTLIRAALLNFKVFPAHSIAQAESLLKSEDFSALLVDIQLPDGDGLRFLTKLKGQGEFAKMPILILSHHSEISNKVMAFSFGAEDFIGKPFDPIELNARVSAKVKKSLAENEEARTRQVGDLLIDFDRMKAFRICKESEKDIDVTNIELKILSLLTKRPEQVYSRENILDQVWGPTYISDRTVDSHIAHLRQKLSGSSVQLETAKNIGYFITIKKK